MNNWPIEFDTPVQEFFVGREKELNFLQHRFLDTELKSICISGTRGVGKTSLALMFAKSNRSAFPAGIFNLNVNALEAVDSTVARYVNRNSRPYLIILNDLEARPQEKVEHELITLRNKHPNARVLATAHLSYSVNSFDLQLRLEGLEKPEFQKLLKKRLKHISSAHLAPELYESLEGHPLAASIAITLLKSGKVTLQELLERLKAFTWSGPVDSLGEEIPEEAPEHQQIIANVRSVSDEFLFKLHKNPELLYELTPRGFEELIAELLGRLDYEVTLTPASRDGGKDLYAAKKDHLGTFLYVVECKKYGPDNPVGVGLVRQLNGVVQAEQANAGILATTSFFTRDAQEFQKTISFQISLKDYLDIQEWFEAALKK